MIGCLAHVCSLPPSATNRCYPRSNNSSIEIANEKNEGLRQPDRLLDDGLQAAQCAEKHWRALNGSTLLEELIRGVQFVDGIKDIAAWKKLVHRI